MIAIVSNIITKPLDKFLELKHFDLDTIFQVLDSKIDEEFLVILFDYRFLFSSFIDEKAFEKLDLLESFLKKFRTLNRAKILISNIFCDFYNINDEIYFQEHTKLLELNKKIANFDVSDLAILNIYEIAINYGWKNIYNEKNGALFQTPFTKLGYELIAKEIQNKIELFNTKRIKALAIDADNTLWGGIVGEDGIDGIKCDENYPGVFYKKFQELLKYIQKSGIVLNIVSKNNFEDVKEVFENKNMPLKWDDFLIKKINWLPKSQNILEIAKEMNIGVDAILFIDDNVREIEEVKDIGVKTFLFDINRLDEFKNLPQLKAVKILDEDIKKANMYKDNLKRGEILKKVSNLDEFIKSLEIKVTVNKNNFNNLKRVTQLINKTNQFNFTTKRYSESEVEEMMKKCEVYDFKVEDKFGDLGIVGVVIVKDNEIDEFLLSCRALGRKIEEVMLKEVIKDNLKAKYIPTQKNAQVKDFFDRFAKEIIKNGEIKEYILDEKKVKNLEIPIKVEYGRDFKKSN